MISTSLIGIASIAANTYAASLDPLASQPHEETVVVFASSVATAPGAFEVQNTLTGDVITSPPKESLDYFLIPSLVSPSS